MLDNVAADDPVKLLAHQRDDFSRVAAVDVVDSLARDCCGARVKLDPDDATFLSGLQRGAQRRFATAEFENRFRVAAHARQ